MAADYKLFVQDAQRVSKEYGVPTSVTLAQIILESSGKYANGLSGLAANHKNLFGVKGTGTNGSVSLPTKEVVNGQYITVNANFRSYSSYYDSLVDHAKLLTNDRYSKHTAGATSPEQFAKGIHKAGYATDPSYSDKLIKIINDYNLKQYDKPGTAPPKGYTLEHTHEKTTTSPTTGTGSAASSGEAAAEKNGFTSQLFFHVTRVGVIAALAVLMIVFFLRAFPAVETVANAVPAGKVLKAAKSIKKGS